MSYCMLWVGGWVGGWVGYVRAGKTKEGGKCMRRATSAGVKYLLGVGGWVGGWVGG